MNYMIKSYTQVDVYTEIPSTNILLIENPSTLDPFNLRRLYRSNLKFFVTFTILNIYQ